MRRTYKDTVSLSFSLEEEERLLNRLRLFDANEFDAPSCSGSFPTRHFLRSSEDALAWQESEHVLRFEYGGL